VTARLILGICLAALVLRGAEARALRVCADPNNLPFSNDREEGFENAIAALVAADLDATPTYVWWAQRRGFARNTLTAGTCDVWPGVATDVDSMTTTRPYYRSTYVFVSRKEDGLGVSSFDDPRLRSLPVGVQMIGNDATNTPPAQALARRGITGNVRGFMLYGDYRRDSPPSAIIDAVGRKDIAVAIAWGPLAGYFAARAPLPLVLAATPAADGPAPMAFSISMGVRKGDTALRDELDAALARNRAQIGVILDRFHVPRVTPE